MTVASSAKSGSPSSVGVNRETVSAREGQPNLRSLPLAGAVSTTVLCQVLDQLGVHVGVVVSFIRRVIGIEVGLTVVDGFDSLDDGLDNFGTEVVEVQGGTVVALAITVGTKVVAVDSLGGMVVTLVAVLGSGGDGG